MIKQRPQNIIRMYLFIKLVNFLRRYTNFIKDCEGARYAKKGGGRKTKHILRELM